MATTELTTANFDEVTSQNGITLIDFWASWCGPCLRFAPTYDRVSEAFPDVTFGKVDTEAQQELAMRYNISSIPTLMIVRDQVVVYSQPGGPPEAMLKDLIKQVQELDMEAIKNEVTAA